jgi:hypothetical protein
MPRAAYTVGAGGTHVADFQLVRDTLAVSSRSGEAPISAPEVDPRSVTILNTMDPTDPRRTMDGNYSFLLAFLTLAERVGFDPLNAEPGIALHSLVRTQETRYLSGFRFPSDFIDVL